jgi:hypothetical protein
MAPRTFGTAIASEAPFRQLWGRVLSAGRSLLHRQGPRPEAVRPGVRSGMPARPTDLTRVRNRGPARSPGEECSAFALQWELPV